MLLSQNELEEGGYYQGEYYVLLLCSVLGMVMMSSSRDLVSVFIALELLSIPAYMLAAWRKRDGRSNEAGVKYYLLGVFASGVLLYGMSLLYGITGSTLLVDIGAALADQDVVALEVIAVAFVVAGFGFKVSAVPFHTWAPDTYEGAPLPVTAFLSVASKAAGFVALILVIFLAFPTVDGVYGPLIWVLAALTMTVGNVIALRQTNIVRMLAYSSVSQGGFILMPLAFVGTDDVAESAMKAVVVYLLVYAFTNLGAFAVVIAVARTTHSGRISSFAGLISWAPGQAVLMTIFLASLAGVPPLGGWIAKFNVFAAVLDAGTTAAYVLAVIGAVNTAIAAAYYLRVMRTMWMDPPPDGISCLGDDTAARDGCVGDHCGRHGRARRAPRLGDALRRPPGPHRRLRQLTTVPDPPLVAGVELGGTKAVLTLASGTTIVDRARVPTDEPTATLDALSPTSTRGPSRVISSPPSGSGASAPSVSIGGGPTTGTSRRHRSRVGRTSMCAGTSPTASTFPSASTTTSSGRPSPRSAGAPPRAARSPSISPSGPASAAASSSTAGPCTGSSIPNTATSASAGGPTTTSPVCVRTTATASKGWRRGRRSPPGPVAERRRCRPSTPCGSMSPASSAT